MKRWSNTFLVGVRKCEMSYSERHGLKAEWTPAPPKNDLSQQEIEQYRAGRDALLAEIGKEMGGGVLVIET